VPEQYGGYAKLPCEVSGKYLKSKFLHVDELKS
jgi:hypothetical protein